MERLEWARFGERVRDARTRAGLSPDDLTLREVCDPDVVQRIEAGELAPDRHLVTYLEHQIGMDGVLLDAWARALVQSHLAEGGPIEPLQRQAWQLREFNPGVIPEFFQTENYTRALGEAARPLEASLSHSELNRARRVRVSSHNACIQPYFCVVVDESALREEIGGPETMREQHLHLASMVSLDHVSLHVIPSGTRLHPSRSGPFRVLSFSPHRLAAYVPAPCGPGQLITQPGLTAAYADLFEAVKGEALSRTASLELLESLVPESETEPKQGADPMADARDAGGHVRVVR
ncbi:hypothetical protein BJF83_03260 [Nocardiopsis sp. CNR-923]|nr:hypothetical protein BJF83_03260 [Nocardiopsis sp. CNR-923]